MFSNIRRIKAGLAASGAVVAVLAIAPAGASAACGSSGGINPGGSACAPTSKARLVRGKAVAPSNAPARGQGRDRRGQPDPQQALYLGRWARPLGGQRLRLLGLGQLRAARRQLPLQPRCPPGRSRAGAIAAMGRFSVYANSGHAYAVIAGLRWDTSMTSGDGPGWSKQMRSSAGYVVRHPSS